MHGTRMNGGKKLMALVSIFSPFKIYTHKHAAFDETKKKISPLLVGIKYSPISKFDLHNVDNIMAPKST